ncbi:MAG TPA: DUF4783 domain-containing protein [Saprospiraceae bacterium]|nr:DUF4783 domain-containing protein [Saprospiraceae bacterium]
MKAGFIILIVSLSPLFLGAQSAILPSPSLSTGVKSSLAMSIGKGDVMAIAEFLADKVELTIESEQEMLMKNETVERLREFYTAHPAKGYIPISSSGSKTEEFGELTTDNGSFQVSLQFTKQTSRRLITAMRLGSRTS